MKVTKSVKHIVSNLYKWCSGLADIFREVSSVTELHYYIRVAFQESCINRMDKIAACNAAGLVFHLKTAHKRLPDSRRYIPKPQKLHGPQLACSVTYLIDDTERTLTKLRFHTILHSDHFSWTEIASFRNDDITRICVIQTHF